VIGIDLVEAMLAGARSRIDRREWQNVHVVRGDATRPPFEQADALVSTFLIGMLRDPQAAIEKWIDHVRPGGQIAIMNAGRSDSSLALPLNLLFRLFVRFSSPGGRLRRTSPSAELDRRWQTARNTLERETVAFETDRMGLGFVRSACGQRSE
jgi:ubiquinone/menaquinone biosynthesis C-methylase UbiE